MTDKRFGNRFKACRDRLGLTQEDLAEKDRSIRTVHFLCRERKKVSPV